MQTKKYFRLLYLSFKSEIVIKTFFSKFKYKIVLVVYTEGIYTRNSKLYNMCHSMFPIKFNLK